MSEPFLGEIRLMSFNFAPSGWALCNGQLLPINQNQALFSLLGTTYGGDGMTSFALPDLRGRMPFHVGGGKTLGQRGGQESVTLTVGQIDHSHPVDFTFGASGAPGTESSPASGVFAATDRENLYAASGSTKGPAMGALAVGSTGGGLAHNNMPPYLTVNLCMALQGIFPSY